MQNKTRIQYSVYHTKALEDIYLDLLNAAKYYVS